MIVRATQSPRNGGRLVTVLRMANDGEIFVAECGSPVRLIVGRGEALWVVESSRPLEWKTEDGITVMCRRRAICDGLLRPIRDPGEDAKDEMLRPLPDEVCA